MTLCSKGELCGKKLNVKSPYNTEEMVQKEKKMSFLKIRRMPPYSFFLCCTPTFTKMKVTFLTRIPHIRFRMPTM